MGPLLLQQSETWLNTAVTVALLGMCVKRHRSAHGPSQS